jgi:hypothetical protein
MLELISKSNIKFIRKPRFQICVAALIFLFLTIITLREFLFGNSYFIYRDVTWPFNNGQMLSDLLYSTNLEFTRRSIYLGPIFAVVQYLGLSSLIAEKLIFLLTHFLIGFFAYVGVYGFLSTKFHNTNQILVFYMSLFAGFFYFLNPIATTMVSPTLGFAFSYALLPLIFYFFDRTLNRLNLWNVLATSGLISLCIAAQIHYIVLIPIFVLLPWLIIFILEKKPIRAYHLAKRVIFSILFIALFTILFSLYWILPALSFSFEDVSLRPRYAVTYETLEKMSQEIDLFDVIRLLGDWWPRLELVPFVGQHVWIPLTLIIPICLISLIIISVVFRSRLNSKINYYLISFALVSLILMFLNKGTQPPFGEVYRVFYSVPLIDWLFRVPSKFAMPLAFYITIIITLGFFNIFASQARSKLARNPIKPSRKLSSSRGSVKLNYLMPTLLASVIVCTCLVSWPVFTGNYNGNYEDGQYLDPWPFQESVSASNIDVRSSQQNILIGGGLEKLVSLAELDSFNSRNSSLIFADESFDNRLYNLTGMDKLVIDRKEDLMMQFLPEGSIIIKPYQFSKRYSPDIVWSKTATNDPGYAPFHKYLDKIGLENSDLDYGMGLVFTSAKDKLEIPVEVSEDGVYDLYVRYMENKGGGMIRIYFDDAPVNIINTKDTQQSGKFIWKNVGRLNLENGKQTLSLENIKGFNAVNLFLLIKTKDIQHLASNLNTVANNSQNIHILEAESEFNSPGKHNGNDFIFNNAGDGTFNTTFANQLRIPQNTTQISLELGTKQNPTSPSFYKIKSFEVVPVSNVTKNILDLGFEPSTNNSDNNQGNYFPLSDNLFFSTETRTPIAGSQSLRIDIEEDESEQWNVLATDYLPLTNFISENASGNLTYRLSISSVNVESIHSRITYFDEDRFPIENRFISFKQKNGTFSEEYKSSDPIPEGVKYFTHQFLVKTNPTTPSHFLIDDVKFTQVYPDKPLRNSFEIFKNDFSDHNHNVMSSENAVQVNITKGNASDWIVLRTLPIDVSNNALYRYMITLETNNTNSMYAKINYLTQDTNELSNYGVQDGVILLSPQSKISANVDIIKTSEYRFATRVKTCEVCSNITIQIGNTVQQLSLENSKTEFKWLYFNSFLPEGNTNVAITSNGETELDKLIIYSDPTNQDVNTLFSQKENTPATSLLKSSVINPMKRELEIDSAKPFIISYLEPYHPLWSAKLNGKEYDPIPIYHENSVIRSQNIISTNYPAINGFIINETGKMQVTIEYEPLRWFYLGASLSFLALVLPLAYLIWQQKHIALELVKNVAIKTHL